MMNICCCQPSRASVAKGGVGTRDDQTDVAAVQTPKDRLATGLPGADVVDRAGREQDHARGLVDDPAHLDALVGARQTRTTPGASTKALTPACRHPRRRGFARPPGDRPGHRRPGRRRSDDRAGAGCRTWCVRIPSWVLLGVGGGCRCRVNPGPLAGLPQFVGTFRGADRVCAGQARSGCAGAVIV